MVNIDEIAGRRTLIVNHDGYAMIPRGTVGHIEQVLYRENLCKVNFPSVGIMGYMEIPARQLVSDENNNILWQR